MNTQQGDRELTTPQERARFQRAWFLGYLAAIVLAELLVVFDPPAGMAGHLIVVFALVVHAAFASEEDRPLLVALVLAPLLRILTLSYPFASSSVVLWYLLTSIPLFIGAVGAAYVLGLSRHDLGLNLGKPLHQLLIAFLSFPLSAIVYAIQGPAPLLSPISWSAAPSIFVVVICTGFLEEFVFRGVLQTTSLKVLGDWGLLYVSAVSAALYIGYRSVAMIAFMFAVSLGFALLVARSRSLLGVSTAHGLANVGLLLVFPQLFGSVRVSGW